MEASTLHEHLDFDTSTSILNDPTQQTKLLASLVLFFITLLCGYLPVRMLLNQNYIQHAMFAGGGVLMATAFCHLIPEAHDNYKSGGHQHQHHHNHNHQHQHAANDELHNHNHSMPNTTTTTAAGVNLTTTSHQQHDHQHHHINDTLAANPSTLDLFKSHFQGLNVPYIEVTLCCGFFFMYLIEQLMVKFINNHTHEHPCDSTNQLVGIGALQSDTQSTCNEIAGGGNGNGVGVGASSTGTSSVGNLSTSPIAPSTPSLNGASNMNRIKTSNGATELYKFIRGLLIISAFGAHSIFDGVAIGSQKTSAEVWTIFIAISCHKLIIAAVVGLELFAATLESHLWTIVHLVIFSIMSPIGIILIVVAQNSLNIDSNDPTMILLQSFATGTLLYIIFVEILQPKEFDSYESKNNKLGKSFSLMAGFGVMLMVLTLMHSH